MEGGLINVDFSGQVTPGQMLAGGMSPKDVSGGAISTQGTDSRGPSLWCGERHWRSDGSWMVQHVEHCKDFALSLSGTEKCW